MAPTRSEQLRAELALAELEETFVAAKEAGKATPKMKLALRAARQKFRELRQAEASK